MYLSTAETCDRIGVSRLDLNRLIAAGVIESKVADPNGELKFDSTLPGLARVLAMSPAERESVRIFQTRHIQRPGDYRQPNNN